MERRKLDLDYIQLFPRTVEHGLAPQHVEQSDFVAECRYVEGFGEAWLLHQQKPPHLVAHVQFATDEADFDILSPLIRDGYNAGIKIKGQTFGANTSRATSPSSVYLPASMLTKCHPLGQTESAVLSVPSVPPQGGGMSMGMPYISMRSKELMSD